VILIWIILLWGKPGNTVKVVIPQLSFQWCLLKVLATCPWVHAQRWCKTSLVLFLQEAFVDPNRDESIIVELLELKDTVVDERSSRWFLQDLANEQDSEQNLVW
jgi:hypothetical protein